MAKRRKLIKHEKKCKKITIKNENKNARNERKDVRELKVNLYGDCKWRAASP